MSEVPIHYDSRAKSEEGIAITVLTINTYREVTNKIYNNYGIGPEQLANICQSLAVAHLNARAKCEKRPNVHYNIWEGAKNDLLDFLEKFNLLASIEAPKAVEPSGELFQ